MLESTQAYKAAIVGSPRHIYPEAILGIISPDLQYGAITASPGQPEVSRLEQLKDEIFDLDANYAALEANRWILDGSAEGLPADSATRNWQAGYVSRDLSGPDGRFSSPQTISMAFSRVRILQYFSLHWPKDPNDGVPRDFTVEVEQGGQVYFSRTVTDNTLPDTDFSAFTVYDPDLIRVTVTRWTLPGRRVRLAEIMPGLYERVDGSKIQSLDVKQQGDVSCTSLPYGTAALSIDNRDRRFEPRSKNGVFQSIEERQGIPISLGVRLADGSVEHKRVGIYYQFSGGWTTGDNGLTMKWNLVDIVGLLANRTFVPKGALPSTLGGWLKALVSQLGDNFQTRWHADPDYVNKPAIPGSPEALEGKSCGDILRWVCQVTGTWPRADADTGDLTAEPLWNQGNKVTLDNLTQFPVMEANDDLASITFTIYGQEQSQITVSGNSSASNLTLNVNNPFIRSGQDAVTVARAILSSYGGIRLRTTGRGDPSSEIGDVDTVWLDASSAMAARRIQQNFSISDFAMRDCASVLLQADGAFLFSEYVVITQPGIWTGPPGVEEIRVILVGRGTSGARGSDGTYQEDGADGADGPGGRVWSDTFPINPEQAFPVSFGADTTFGIHSSANGKVYPYGFTDVASGKTYARTGVASPLPGSGDGGKGGTGGGRGWKEKEERRDTHYNDAGEVIGYYWYQETVLDIPPEPGTPGAPGASGCAVVWWAKPEKEMEEKLRWNTRN